MLDFLGGTQFFANVPNFAIMSRFTTQPAIYAISTYFSIWSVRKYSHFKVNRRRNQVESKSAPQPKKYHARVYRIHPTIRRKKYT